MGAPILQTKSPDPKSILLPPCLSLSFSSADSLCFYCMCPPTFGSDSIYFLYSCFLFSQLTVSSTLVSFLCPSAFYSKHIEVPVFRLYLQKPNRFMNLKKKHALLLFAIIGVIVCIVSETTTKRGDKRAGCEEVTIYL